MEGSVAAGQGRSQTHALAAAPLPGGTPRHTPTFKAFLSLPRRRRPAQGTTWPRRWGTSRAASARRQIPALPQPPPVTPARCQAGVLLPALGTSPHRATAAQDVAGPHPGMGGGQFRDGHILSWCQEGICVPPEG